MHVMKKYRKPAVKAKNLPTGSYAAGCPQHHSTSGAGGMQGEKDCKKCEMSA